MAPIDDSTDVKKTSETIETKDLHRPIIPILPIRGTVAFPGMKVPLGVTANAATVVEEAMASDRIVGLLTVKQEDAEDPVPGQIYETGTLAKVMHVQQNDDGSLIALVNGISRIRVKSWHVGDNHLMADVVHAPEVVDSEVELEALHRQLKMLVGELLSMAPQIPEEMANAISGIEDPLQLAYVSAFNISLDTETRQELLETDSVGKKIRDLLPHLLHEKELLEIGKQVQSEMHEKMDKSKREYLLRQQLDAIRKELGENDEKDSEADAYQKRIDASHMSDEARKEAERELERFRHLSPQSAEYPMIKTYLDWLTDLPWAALSVDNGDVAAARAILNGDHYGLDEIKERLVEYIAVRSLMKDRGMSAGAGATENTMGVILCLVGPPGVGKTSLGRSMANALGREFTRMSLGGVRDEAEIRGHRRTYVGAMPGRIIQAIKRAGTRNPLFMLDEIDKVGQDWRGDPSSALLEVLDPAQNGTFRDHFLDVDFDLSEVVFIATANQLDTIPAPLRDRMEIIQIEGYTELEKMHIARRHLIPRQLQAHGLSTDEVTFIDDAIEKIIQDYTREAGVRNLERHISAICRKAIVHLSEQGYSHAVITSKLVRDYLKKERFVSEAAESIRVPGIATGLAVTSTGGDILYIEASRMAGKGRLKLTGQLGDVMKESAEIAHSYVRASAGKLNIDPAIFDNTDVHLHVPAGALPKDGPSAGVAMVMALASLYTDKPVRGDLGITGEITLRGRVLPVGGVKMKALAAHRAGLKKVIIPQRNEKDLDELPDEIRESMKFITADRMDDVIAQALAGGSTDAAEEPWSVEGSCGGLDGCNSKPSPAMA